MVTKRKKMVNELFQIKAQVCIHLGLRKIPLQPAPDRGYI
jgi:hypothetical protein